MPISMTIIHQFDAVARKHGLRYQLEGKVVLTNCQPDSVYATVLGTRDYAVDIRIDRSDLEVSCTCPRYEDGHLCKHLFATLLEADKDGVLHIPRDAKVVEVEPDAEPELVFGRGGGLGAANELLRSILPGIANRFAPTETSPPPKASRRRPSWKEAVDYVKGIESDSSKSKHPVKRDTRQVIYGIDVASTCAEGILVMEFARRKRKKNGEWSQLQPYRLGEFLDVDTISDPIDRQILAAVKGACQDYRSYYHYYGRADSAHRIPQALWEVLLPIMVRTGRCMLKTSTVELSGHIDASERALLGADDAWVPTKPLEMDDGPPWEFRLDVTRDGARKPYVLGGALYRGDDRIAISEPDLLLAGGWMFARGRLARLDDAGAFEWIMMLRNKEAITIPAKQGDAFVEQLFGCASLPQVDLPEGLRLQEVTATPVPTLVITAPKKSSASDRLRGELSFRYDETLLPADDPRSQILLEGRRFLRRNRTVERAAAERLIEIGFRSPRHAYNENALELAPRYLSRIVRALVAEGWHVEAQGSLYRRASAFSMSVSSGIDWFELHGVADFGEAKATLPALLAAAKKRDNFVRLDDGTFGLLPEDWLRKCGLVAKAGKVEGDHLRFTKCQAGLLDALLAAEPDTSCDETFRRMREELEKFTSIKPKKEPAGFTGKLRAYQREGLGWFDFLERFGFGGCLADDMGLGKTVQVLALLEARRADGSRPRRPSLVVVPRSIVYNWIKEGARFAPRLRMLDYTGIGRKEHASSFDEYDIIVTTYGTLRRDAVTLKDVEFDYVILDEAQMIKNAGTATAKAARLLHSAHRLALSGTPVENHIGELWSIFEFLNPGMLGTASVFKKFAGSVGSAAEDDCALLARALRPFILRRTKDKVARDLPAKTEQTLHCELDKEQRKLYNELRDHYRDVLLSRIDRVGLGRAKIQVLEALLRLRQAACHPGLIDKKWASSSSAKLDVLLPQLAEVLDEGHKVLVFSQFTSFLRILRDRLDAVGTTYEYLDGKTRKRAEHVERFQNDPDCKLFLISLKAGGLGLNLTAAEYIFLLDPWWNPAVEAQAIDRAHRIGQTRRVFAYRLIARDTVEEKVVELQRTKRALADAIINADKSLIRDLSRDDLELLLA